MADSAADFVLQHSFAAQIRSRTNTGSSAGVSIAEIREHLLDKVPGLKKHEISLSTVGDFFKPQTEEILLAKKYKALPDAKIGVKKNNYREYHQDSHYLFTQNKQRREFGTLLGSDACILSMDDMAKIKVEALALVSRCHQVRRLFPSTDIPNPSDHDFPVPNYCLSVSGYMYLEQVKDESHESDLPT